MFKWMISGHRGSRQKDKKDKNESWNNNNEGNKPNLNNNEKNLKNGKITFQKEDRKEENEVQKLTNQNGSFSNGQTSFSNGQTRVLTASQETLDDSNEYTTLDQIQQQKEKFHQLLASENQPRVGDERIGSSTSLLSTRMIYPVAVGSQPNLAQYSMYHQGISSLPAHEDFSHLPPQAPGTCTLPRRSMVKENDARFRSPSNPPPNSHLPPRYRQQEACNWPIQPPQPPRVPQNSLRTPYNRLPPNSLVFQQDAINEQRMGFKDWPSLDQCTNFKSSLCSKPVDFCNPRTEGTMCRQEQNFKNGQYQVPEDQTAMPSKSTEDLLNASRVTKDNIANHSQANQYSMQYSQVNSMTRNCHGHEPTGILSSDAMYPGNESLVKNRQDEAENLRNQVHSNDQRLNGEMITFRSSRPNNMGSTARETAQRYSEDQYHSDFSDHSKRETNEDQLNTKMQRKTDDPVFSELFISEDESALGPQLTRKIHRNNSSETNCMKKRPQRNGYSLDDRNSIVVMDVPRKNYDGSNSLIVKDIPTYSDRNPNEEENEYTNRKGDGSSASVTSSSSSWMEWTQQLNAYVAWVNSQLRKKIGCPLVSDLRKDFQSGEVFADLIEIIASEKVAGIMRNADSSQIRKENLDRVLQFMAAKRIRMTHITSKEIAEGNLKSIMRVILALAAHYKPQSVREGSKQHGCHDLQQNIGEDKVVSNRVEMHDIGVGPDIPTEPSQRTPSLTRRNLDGREDPEDAVPLRRHPSLTPRPSSPSPVYENLSKRTSGSRWAYDSLRASHKFYWENNASSSSVSPQRGRTTQTKETKPSNELSEQAVNSTFSTSRSTSLNNSFDGENDSLRFSDASCDRRTNKPAALSFWQELQGRHKDNDTDLNPFRYHTVHRSSGRRRLPRIPGQHSPSSSNSRVTTPIGAASDVIDEETFSDCGGRCTRKTSIDESSREPEGRSQNSSPATSLGNGPVIESWRQILGHEDELKGALTKVQTSRNQLVNTNGSKEIDISQPKTDSCSPLRRQDFERNVLEMKALENEKADQSRQIQQKEAIIADLRNQLSQKDKSLHTQRQLFEETLRTIQNGRVQRKVECPGERHQNREELELVRETISALRNNFRESDPNQHTLDTLEQVIAILVERCLTPSSTSHEVLNGTSSKQDARILKGNVPDFSTKFIYYTDRSVTPFMSSINKRVGEITLRDFRETFDRPGNFRFHFKSHDPEYGPVKEEIADDDSILPGIDGKIIVWVEED